MRNGSEQNMFDLNVEADSEAHQNHNTMCNFLSLNISENYNGVIEGDEVTSSNNDQEELMTREFFPVTSEGQGSGEVSMAHKLWLNMAAPPPEPPQAVTIKKSRRGPRSRSSQYRGVTFYRRTGRWESHIWDCGKQVYLGGFDTAHAAARAYDRAAIKFRGVDADINFHVNDYEEDKNQMGDLTKEEFVQILRRQTTGFTRGNSKYGGATMGKCGRWEARMGQFLGKKGYDLATFTSKGKEAMPNFSPSNYPGMITFAAENGGRSEDLDLNLSVSTPSEELVNGNFRTMQFQPTALE